MRLSQTNWVEKWGAGIRFVLVHIGIPTPHCGRQNRVVIFVPLAARVYFGIA